MEIMQKASVGAVIVLSCFSISANATPLEKALESYYYLGRSCMDYSDFKGAETNYTTCLKLDPFKGQPSKNPKFDSVYYRTIYAWCHQNRGFMYCVKGDYPKAIADLNEAIRLRPAYAENYKNRGLAYQKLGNSAAMQRDTALYQQLTRNPIHDDYMYLIPPKD